MIYGKNITSLGSYGSGSVVAEEGYEGVVGSLQIMTESYINEGKMFKYLIEKDFQEAVDIQNGVFTESVEVVTESASDIFNKIKEMIKKAWAKVKGLFKNFIAKFDIMMKNDTKSLYKKYAKQWVNGRTKKLKKYKYCKMKSGKDLSKDGFITETDILERYGNTVHSIIRTNEIEKLNEISDELNDGSALDELLSAILETSTDAKSFAKDFHDEFFDDEETYTDEVLDQAIVSDVDKYLNQNKLIDGIKKAANNNDKVFRGLLKNIDNAQKTVVNYMSSNDTNAISISLTATDKEGKEYGAGDTDKKGKKHGSGNIDVRKTNADLRNKQIGLIRSEVSIAQRAVNMCNSAYLAAAKFEIAQCKRIFSQVVSKGINEAAYLDAIGEGAEFEVYTDLQ